MQKIMSNYSFDDAVKQHLVSTLSYTIEFLNQHGLSWWMAFGSCLGTIRHQGFIPWDDDIDIHMPREDYEKLLMQKDLFEGNGYSIVSIEDKGYYLPMAKIIDKSTTLVESRDFDFVMGVFVDIFPVDFVDEIDERLSGEYVWTRMDYIDSFRKFTVRDYVFMIKNKQFNRVVNSIMGRVFGAPYIKKKLEGVKLFEKKLKEKSKNAKYAFSDGIFLDKTLFDEMIATRRAIHKRPEEGWTEFETTWFVVNRLKEIGYEYVEPDGAFYLFVKALEPDAKAFSERAKAHELLLVPSDDFGCTGYVRICYCVSLKTIQDSMPAFKALFDSYK